MSSSSTDVDSMVTAVQWVGAVLGIFFIAVIGGVIYLCCRRSAPEGDNRALLDGLLRRDQLEESELEGDDRGWQCVVCAYTNKVERKTCLMCGTAVGTSSNTIQRLLRQWLTRIDICSADFLVSKTLNRHKSSKTILQNAVDDAGAGVGDAPTGTSEEEDLRARQRAFVKRRLNALEARQSLSQRQRGAIRRRVWERKQLDDGKFHWIRQNSKDVVSAQLPSASSTMLSTSDSLPDTHAPKGVALSGPDGQSVVDYHNLRSQGFVSHYDELGRLAWKRADEGTNQTRLGMVEATEVLMLMLMLMFVCVWDSVDRPELVRVQGRTGGGREDRLRGMALEPSNLVQTRGTDGDIVYWQGVMALGFQRKKQWFLIHLSRIATPVTEAVAKLSTCIGVTRRQSIRCRLTFCPMFFCQPSPGITLWTRLCSSR